VIRAMSYNIKSQVWAFLNVFFLSSTTDFNFMFKDNKVDLISFDLI
jgi:hypothetical protein